MGKRAIVAAREGNATSLVFKLTEKPAHAHSHRHGNTHSFCLIRLEGLEDGVVMSCHSK